MFIVASFVIAENWEWCQRSSAGEWINCGMSTHGIQLWNKKKKSLNPFSSMNESHTRAKSLKKLNCKGFILFVSIDTTFWKTERRSC